MIFVVCVANTRGEPAILVNIILKSHQTNTVLNFSSAQIHHIITASRSNQYQREQIFPGITVGQSFLHHVNRDKVDTKYILNKSLNILVAVRATRQPLSTPVVGVCVLSGKFLVAAPGIDLKILHRLVLELSHSLGVQMKSHLCELSQDFQKTWPLTSSRSLRFEHLVSISKSYFTSQTHKSA